MESNSPGIEKSEQIVWSSDDQGSGHVKSYKCNFCKRGFSNAQALGGHMNIHRKDRAKLRQSSSEDLSVDSITAKNPSNHPQASADNDSLQPESSEDQKSSTPKAKDGVEELWQLPLFVDTPLASDDLKVDMSSRVSGHDKKRMQLSHSSSSQTELDLELRLGPEPHETSATGTRNFF